MRRDSILWGKFAADLRRPEHMFHVYATLKYAASLDTTSLGPLAIVPVPKFRRRDLIQGGILTRPDLF